MMQRPIVECEQQHPTLFVPDVKAAAGFYEEKLGFKTAFLFGEPPTMAGMNLGHVQMFLEEGRPNPDDGLRDYRIRDLNGYDISFGHHTFKDGPQIEIERVDVPVRLEKRLAALLVDLAAFKHMSLNSCLEEILLHTNERLGDGVASPHTMRDLRYIHELKKKHGIDYDSHGSYRFVEK